MLKPFIGGKKCLEIGGPSAPFSEIYSTAGSVDNVVFSLKTVWHTFQESNYSPSGKVIGKVFEMDGSDLNKISDSVYDSVVSSHNLEHMANPLKALKEWSRVICPNGYIILILPNKKFTFDHRRDDTVFQTILDKFNRNVGEDNLDSLPEILRLHDLPMDPPAGNFEQFTKRSLDNYNNRCLHHHVFTGKLIVDICQFLGLQLVKSNTETINMLFVLQKV